MAQSTILAANLSTPTADTFVLADSGGTLPDSTTYYYRVSAINAQGETLAFAEVSQATGTGGAGNAHTITVKWLEVTGASGYRVYGRATGAQELLSEVSGGSTLLYLDDGSATPDGALPVANTAVGSAGTSSDVVVATGAHVNVGIFTADDAGIPGNQSCKVYQDTPGSDVLVGSLNGHAPVMKLVGPGTFRVVRPAVSATADVGLGVFLET